MTKDGRRLGIATAAVDTGGTYTTQAYEFCRARSGRRVWAIKGGPIGTPVVDKVSWVGRGKQVPLRLLGVDEIKSTLMDRLRLENAGPGYCHFPRGQARGYTQSWFDGLLSEHHILVRRAGKERLEWVCPTGVRNEPLDCRVYATAALEILSPRLDPVAKGKAPRAPVAAGKASRPGRRVLGRGVG
jgi:phage terminase large subunit GpA-like protein